MASLFTHGLVACVIGTFQPAPIRTVKFWLLSILCAIIPDVDVIGLYAGIEYGDLFGHRGLTHSLFFSAVLTWVVISLAFPGITLWSRMGFGLFMHFLLVTASHGLLDAITDGGLGVAFFSPFDETRYFFPWRPVKVSPIGITGFFSGTGLLVLASEVMFIWIPIFLLVKITGWLGRRKYTV